MQPEQTGSGQVVDADSVMRFLTRNPEFFNQHAEMLPRLRIPHPSGKAVSLIEKQVSVLRNKCGSLENSLRDLIAVARENEQLQQRINVLVQDIITAPTPDEIIALTRASLLENFNADDVRALLYTRPAPKTRTRRAVSGSAGKGGADKKGGKAISSAALKPVADKPDSKGSARATGKAAGKASAKATSKTAAKKVTNVASRRASKASKGAQSDAPLNYLAIPATDARLECFKSLFDKRETVCGLPSAEQIKLMVGEDHAHVASAAMVPLQHKHEIGVIMLTSKDESRFSHGKGVMFLNLLGEVLARRLHVCETLS